MLKQYPVLELGCFVLKQFFVFSLTGQVNAKKGENMHTKESTFLMVWLKNQKINTSALTKMKQVGLGFSGLE